MCAIYKIRQVKSLGLYQDSISGSRIPQNAKYNVPSILGRLIPFEHNTKSMLLQDKKIALNLLARLGFLVNAGKKKKKNNNKKQTNRLQPTHQKVYKEGLFDLRKGIVIPPLDRIQKTQLTVNI